VVDEERSRLEAEHARLLEERRDMATQFMSDKQLLTMLHVDLNTGMRPLPAEWLQGGIELLLRLHETSARLVELDARLAHYRNLL
jgi:hypothetical protein